MSKLPVLISCWNEGGVGVASYPQDSGKTIDVAVPGTIVGEQVEIETLLRTRRACSRYTAQSFTLCSPSPDRVFPRCPHAGVCGGCTWQHISYERQLREKEQLVRDVFSPLCPSLTILPIIGCSSPWQYRNKMEFSFSQAKDGTHFLGLYGAGSRRVIDISSCYIAPEWMTCALAEVRAWWKTTGLMAYRQNVNEGTLLTVCFREARSSHDRMVILTVSGVPEFAPKREQLDLFVQSLRAAVTPQQGSLSIVLRVRQIAKGRPTQMFEMILFGPDHMKETVSVTIDGVQKKLECHISPPTFFQPNTPQAEKIYSHALSSARLNATDVVADLYCGLGLFGMFSAFFASSAFGVELSKDAAYDATVNSQRLGISNFAVRCGDVAKICNDLPKAPSVVIVDPPRSGLGAGGIDAVESLHPSRIVYVSCQPKTQGTDVQTLMEHGWTIESVQPIDQFPHTMHVENIVVLSKI